MVPTNVRTFPSPLLPALPVLFNPLNASPDPNPSSHLSHWWPSPAIRARRLHCGCGRGGAPWDSNAESIRSRRFGFRKEDSVEGGVGGGDGGFWRREKRRWWSDQSSDELDDGLEEDVFDDEEDDPPKQLWDRIWIFKVFKSYGYMLPAIIASMLLATGPKAFLMALALPLGQSALSLAIEKLWGNSREWEGPRSRRKTKKKPFARSANDFGRQGQKEGPVASGKRRQNYQSWTAEEVGAPDKGRSSRRSNYGGWDELDRRKASIKGSMRTQTANASAQAASASKTKLSIGGRYRGSPLFLRLLIAVFPFLGSWTRIL